MPRPDLTEERTAQILDAAVARISATGSMDFSLQQVADEAGVHKSIIRHYVGAKRDLVNALADRALSEYRSVVAGIPTEPPGSALDQVLDLLFATSEDDALETILLDALIRSQADYPDAVARVVSFLDDLTSWILQRLRHLETDTPDADLIATADGLVSLAIAADAIESLGGRALPGSRRAAELLIAHVTG